MISLEGKVAIVTGSGRGIGRATAVILSRLGARVLVNDVDEEPARETEALVREQGGGTRSSSWEVWRAPTRHRRSFRQLWGDSGGSTSSSTMPGSRLMPCFIA